MVGQLVRSDRCNDDDNDDHYKVGDVNDGVGDNDDDDDDDGGGGDGAVVSWSSTALQAGEKCVHLKCARPAKDIKSTKNVPRQKIDISKSAWWHVLEFDLC